MTINFYTQPVSGGYKIVDTSTNIVINEKRLIVKSNIDGFVHYDQVLPVSQTEITIPVDISWASHLTIAQVNVTLIYNYDLKSQAYSAPTTLNLPI